MVVFVVAAVLIFGRRSRASVRAPTPGGGDPEGTLIEEGIASFYGPGFHGRLTANGETFDQMAMTAAHRTLPFNTRVKVTDLDTGASVVVRINDRGPFTKKNGVFARCIDLSVGAAAAIGLDIQRGLARVRLEKL